MIQTNLELLKIKGRKLLPIVQGGMGVGISAHSLASAVASENAVGTIASVDLRHLHQDLMEQSKGMKTTEEYDELNLIALDREIKKALKIANNRGMISVNVMKAVQGHKKYVKQACESGAHAITMGAGLPLDLPEMVAEHPQVALMPILSDSRGIAIMLKKWMRKGRLPDAIVIEHPRHAAGHLGAPKRDDINNPKYEFPRVIEETMKIFKELAIESEKIPLIVAGGINSFEKVKKYLGIGASAVQVGTAFAVTKESDPHLNFKKVLANAKPSEIVEFMSVAGLPARAVLTPFLKSYLIREEKLQANAKADPRRCTQGLNCLSVCGLRDGISKIGQFCIDLKLAAAYRGEVSKGLFFRGSEKLPFDNAIRSVQELITYFMTGEMPVDLCPSKDSDEPKRVPA